MPRMDFRRSSWLVTLPLMLAAVLYLALAWLPGRRAIQKTVEEVRQKQQYVAQAATSAMTLTAAQQKLAKIQAVVQRWQAASPGMKKLPEFFGKINALAKQSGATITRFDPQLTVSFERISEKPVAISCTGNFHQIYDFIRGIEQLSATVWLNSVKIEKLQSSDKNVQCNITLGVFSENSEISDYTKSAK